MDVARGTSVPSLLQELATTSDASERERIRRSISDQREAALAPMVDALRTGNPHLGAAVMWVSLGLQEPERTTFAARMDEVLRDPNEREEARKQAGLALGYDPDHGVKHLLGALNAEDPFVRRSASWALRWSGDKGGLEAAALRSALADSDARVRENIAATMIEMPAQLALVLSDLVAMLDDSDALVRSAAIKAVSAAGEAALPHLVDAVCSEVLKNQFRLAPIFAALGDRGMAELIKLLKSGDKARVLSALGIVQTMGAQARRALPAIRALQGDKDKEIRWYAKAAQEMVDQ